jgi:nondiscriminating glutamyl-tRNA synthetase
MERVNNSPSVFDVEKLNWMNGHHIREAELERIVDLAIPYLQEEGYIDDELSDEEYNYVAQIVDVVRDSLDYVAQITEEAEIFLTELEYEDVTEAEETFQEDQVDLVLETLKDRLEKLTDFEVQQVRAEMNQVISDLPVGGRLFFHPVRLSLTGRTSGPELYNVAALLGKEETINRLEKALKLA